MVLSACLGGLRRGMFRLAGVILCAREGAEVSREAHQQQFGAAEGQRRTGDVLVCHSCFRNASRHSACTVASAGFELGATKTPSSCCGSLCSCWQRWRRPAWRRLVLLKMPPMICMPRVRCLVPAFLLAAHKGCCPLTTTTTTRQHFASLCGCAKMPIQTGFVVGH